MCCRTRQSLCTRTCSVWWLMKLIASWTKALSSRCSRLSGYCQVRTAHSSLLCAACSCYFINIGALQTYQHVLYLLTSMSAHADGTHAMIPLTASWPSHCIQSCAPSTTVDNCHWLYTACLPLLPVATVTVCTALADCRWNFLSPEFETKFQRKVPLFLEIPIP